MGLASALVSPGGKLGIAGHRHVLLQRGHHRSGEGGDLQSAHGLRDQKVRDTWDDYLVENHKQRFSTFPLNGNSYP